jgi:tetrahydromethanopterin S-methyltransferase subunit A
MRNRVYVVCSGTTDGEKGYHMTRKTFALMARVSTENPHAIKRALQELVSTGSVTPTDEGFVVKATMQGEDARELNRTLLSALRRVERKTRLRAEWESGGTTERFFDYVPKGSRKA